MLTVSELIAFEDDIAAEFAAGNIKAPVHLSGGNEAELLEIFKSIAPEDWVFCTWRSHYHCLLKGVPPAEVKAAIMAGRSIALCFPEYRVLSSAIVGGICPIAMGMAWAIKHVGPLLNNLISHIAYLMSRGGQLRCSALPPAPAARGIREGTTKCLVQA